MLKGKVIVVTGASSGIGATTGQYLGAAGAKVVLAARRQQSCEALAQQIRDAGGQALSVKCDVNDEQQIQSLIQQTVQHFGRLDGAFNNAGYVEAGAPLHEQTNQAYEQVMNTNVRSMYWCMKYQLIEMLKTGSGSIVNNASICGLIGFSNVALYCASKHAVIGMTKAIALENYQHGIRINAVCPGPIVTPMSDKAFGSPENREAFTKSTPAGRTGTTDEVAQAVLFLLSEQASYIAGHSLPVDGAYTVQ